MNIQEARLEGHIYANPYHPETNLSAVLDSFRRVVAFVWEQADKEGKDYKWVNKHPLVRKYIRALDNLTSM